MITDRLCHVGRCQAFENIFADVKCDGKTDYVNAF